MGGRLGRQCSVKMALQPAWGEADGLQVAAPACAAPPTCPDQRSAPLPSLPACLQTPARWCCAAQLP